ncbi:MAG TPA: DUF3106 domain-containing protein [Myxococcaceae bacterium]|nr:DUF3106 domain-containing protein [Myxococcaceae bacterium]
MKTWALTPKPPGSIRPSLALAADPGVARRFRDSSPAPSSLLGLGRDCRAIIRSIPVVSALVAALLTVGLARAQTGSAPAPAEVAPQDDAAARFDRMSEQEKAQLRERLKQYRALPLDEQARLQANVARWRALPPEEKARVRQNLESFQRLSPDERQKLLAQWREFQKLTPDQRHELRQQVREYLRANPERRRQMMENIRAWRSMTREQRELMRQRLREMRERRGK